MVFLRLTVKVFPRDQAPPSNSFSFRSLLGDRERDDPNRTANASWGKPASFLIVLENPEDVTLGGLAGMIRTKWRKLRPGVEPLAIKHLLDDDHEAGDLDTDMTVEDVFVDKGKARADGFDQRRTVRVIQKPAPGVESPVRFPSVTQDWDAAAEHYEIQRQKKLKQEAKSAVHKLGSIEEETRQSAGLSSPFEEDRWAEYTPRQTHRRDIPVSSVEKDVEIPGSPSQPAPYDPSQGTNGEDAGAAPEDRLESEELGDSPRSSRAVTPKQPTPRPGSSHSQGSRKRSATGEAVTDSPALQLALEHNHSVSPQKNHAPEVTKTGSPDDETSSEEESESEDPGSDKEDGKAQQDKDGDVTMGDEAASGTKPGSPEAAKQPIIAPEEPAPELAVQPQSRKRKNSTDHSSSNKEPRLDRTTPPPAANGVRRNSAVSPSTPRFSPSGKRMGGTESFSGVARRLSFSDRGSEAPSQGLGLGITRSPPKKPSAPFERFQDSTQSQEALPHSPMAPPSSAPVRRTSVAQNTSTPTNAQTPAENLKNRHSALRKGASTERNRSRRSVSFVEGDEPVVPASQPAPTSTPMDTAKSSKKIVAAQTASSDRRRSGSTMAFPPGVSMERIAQISRQIEQEAEQRDKEIAEFEGKIKAAEMENADSEYAKLLRAAFKTWTAIDSIAKNHDKISMARTTRLSAELEMQKAELKKMEESTDTAPSQQELAGTASSQQKSKKAQKSQKSKSQQATKNDDAASKPTPALAINGDGQSPATQASGWNAVNVKSPAKDVKPSQPKAEPESKSAPRAPLARTVATRTLSQPSKSASQNSTSDEVELPTMKVQARTNAKKPTHKSDEESSSESESESSSSESSESESESESGSGSESGSESEEENKPTASTAPKAAPIASLKSLKANSPPSAQRNTKYPAPTSQQVSQSQPQTESWRWPRNSQTAPAARLSLKSIKGEVASQAKAQAAAKAAPAKRDQGRKDIFSPPDSDSDETESESESESESSSSSDDDDGDSDNEAKSKSKTMDMKRAQSPGSVADAGDITATGQVQRLRTARAGKN